jgi:hypothetical protein
MSGFERNFKFCIAGDFVFDKINEFVSRSDWRPIDEN